MSNVIGPITKEDWNTLIFLKRHIKDLQEKRDPRFDKFIDVNRSNYQKILLGYSKAA